MTRTKSIAIVLLSLVACANSTTKVETKTLFRDSVESLLKMAIEKDHLPSLSVAVSKDGKIIFQEAYGFSDVENNVPASTKSVYRIGSVSKSLTASVIMSLYDKGLLDLNDPIQKYCTAFPEKGAPITIKQLSCHQGGIRHYSNEHFVDEYYSTTRYTSSADAVSVFKNDSLVALPGTKYFYSSYGYGLLGCAIESINKSTYEEALNQYIFIPAGMAQSTLDYSEKIVPYRVKPYERNKDGSPRNARSTDLSNKFPGGGILSTSTDLVKFGNALLEGKLLKKSTLDKMWTKQFTVHGKSTGYCLGWAQYDDQNEVFHGGSSAGGTAYLYILKKEKIVIAFMTNTENWGDPRYKLAKDIAKVL
jgi:CubicO group peptidase (beta-lactamase class C family)